MLASNRVKEYAESIFGGWGRRGYRIFYNIFALVTLMPVFYLAKAFPDQPIYQIPYPWVIVSTIVQGISLVVLGLGIFQTGFWDFLGVRQLVSDEENQPTELVISGLYCYVRHPLYTAGLVLIWLIPEMTVNALALAVGLSIYLIVGAGVEEKKLIGVYGTAYRRYMQQTPMLIPRLRKCSEGRIRG